MLVLTDRDKFTTFTVEKEKDSMFFNISIQQGDGKVIYLSSDEDLDTLKAIINYCEK